MKTSAIVNAAAFQASWWVCLLGAANGVPWVGPAMVLLFAGGHVWLAVEPVARAREVRLLATAALLGYALDSALVVAQVLRFPEHAWLGAPSTLWMVALWVNLALTLRSSMAWLLGRPILAGIFGAVGGPLAYVAGERLGAATLGPTLPAAVAAIAIEWGLAMPVLVWLAGPTRARMAGRLAQE